MADEKAVKKQRVEASGVCRRLFCGLGVKRAVRGARLALTGGWERVRLMAMDKDERKFFERMSKAQEQMTKAQERMADVMEKQQPGKADQFLTTAAAVATTIGSLSFVDVIIKWFTGG
jgi:hypothetical protein